MKITKSFRPLAVSTNFGGSFRPQFFQPYQNQNSLLVQRQNDNIAPGALGTIGRASGTIGITIVTNSFTNGTIGRTLNDIGIPLVPLVEP